MKKITFIFALMFSGSLLFGQAIVDNAVIPVSVTLNSILRLNVTSGGNIEFVVSTLDQYTSGLDGTSDSRYQTTFTVASSVDFNVVLSSETAALVATSGNALDDMPMNNLGYTLDPAATGGIAGDAGDGANWDLTPNETAAEAPAVPSVAGATIVQSLPEDGTDLGGAGNTTQNDFIIFWRLGTTEGAAMNTQTLLQSSISPDRYSTNIYLSLVEQP